MSGPRLLDIPAGAAPRRDALPRLDGDDLAACVAAAIGGGARIASLFAHPLAAGGQELIAVLADDRHGRLAAVAARPAGRDYLAVTARVPEAHWFEREIAEQSALEPIGHPWLKPLRFPPGADRAPHPRPGVVDFFRIDGEAAHEVAVGPVHAGIIEPGHFRFQCAGETVLHLEIELGYQHRGVERALRGGPDRRTVHLVETLAGDTTIGHATAYALACEALAGVEAPPRAQVLRGIALELERLANHAGDLGALAGDVAFQPTAAACGLLRGELLNLTALVCGNRFGRGMVRPGGVAFDLEPERARALGERLARTMAELARPVALLFDVPAVLARFEETGAVPADMAREIGLVGPAARASGLPRDVRITHPGGAYRALPLEIAAASTGDVLARAEIRAQELRASAAWIARALDALPEGPIAVDLPPAAPDSLAVGHVEAWRGEVCHVALTGPDGRFAHYKITDPSFHNWFGLACALRGQAISDFPLCNKSFNLSYCGHDL